MKETNLEEAHYIQCMANKALDLKQFPVRDVLLPNTVPQQQNLCLSAGRNEEVEAGKGCIHWLHALALSPCVHVSGQETLAKQKRLIIPE